jgi:drug/metabolite transporter (DMT)-like permease
MSSTLFFSIIAILLLGAFYFLKKIIIFNVPPFLAVVFIYLGGLIFALVSFLISRPEIQMNAGLKKGLGLALLAGVIIASFDILNLIIFKRGGDMAFFAPIFNGGAIFVASLTGILLLKESISAVQFSGILLIMGGIFLLAKF